MKTLWLPITEISQSSAPEIVKHFFADFGSLTLKLSAAYGDVAVKVLSEQPEKLYANEEALLECDKAQIRKVILHNSKQDLVFARSVFPAEFFNSFNQEYKNIQDNSLGSKLFAEANMLRAEVYFAQLRDDSPLQAELDKHNLWARISKFIVNEQAMLVNEVFLA